MNNDTFVRLPVLSAQFVIGTDKNHDTAILIIYNADDYSQGYGQIKEAFRARTNDNILQPYITEDDFRSSNDGVNIAYKKHDFDIRYQKNFERGQSVKVELKFDGVVPAGIYSRALILTNRLVSTNSDGQRMFDLSYIQFFHNILCFFNDKFVLLSNDLLYLSFNLSVL